MDDIIITRGDTVETSQLKQTVSKEFGVKDLGQQRYFLGSGNCKVLERDSSLAAEVCLGPS